MPILLGLLGVLGFSFTLPVTRVAVENLDPVFVGLGRAAVAALPAAALLALWGERLPDRGTVRRLGLVALGVVFGFPLLSALALRELSAAHSAVIVGLLPAATAVAAVARADERPSGRFWVASGAGLAAVLAFAASQGAGVSGADLLVLAAVALGAIGYAEGGALARDMGGSRVICWALVLSFPITAAAGTVGAVLGGVDAPAEDWLGFAYVALISQFLAFFAWYAGLARGGVAKIVQVQLVQPLLTLVWAALLVGEHIGTGTLIASIAVVACVVATQRARVDSTGRDRRAALIASPE